MVMVLFEDIQQGKNVNKLHSKRKSDRIVTENIKPELGGSGFKKQRDSGESDYSEDTINPTIADSSNFRNKEIGDFVSNSRFIKFIPSETSDWLQEKYPNAFLLLCLIAKRARRYKGHVDGLEIGMALIGDYRKAGIETEKKYRVAKDVLLRIGAIEIIETARNRKKRATERATNGTLVKILKSDVWDVNLEVDGDIQGDRRATEGRPKGDEQEGKERKKEEEDHHPLTPSSFFDELIDDSFSKKEEKIHVHRECYLTQEELNECIKIRGSRQIVEEIITDVLDWPKRKYEIKNWSDTIKTWILKNKVIKNIEENELLGNKIEEMYGQSEGWRASVFRCGIKNDRGILFECLGGYSESILISFSDGKFKEKCMEKIKEKNMKQKGGKNA